MRCFTHTAIFHTVIDNTRCHENISAMREMQCDFQSSTAQHGGHVTHISRDSHK